MAVNITCTGDVYNYSNIKFTSDEIRYQAYFYKVVSGSSSSTWGNPLNTILGQYNFNVADIIGTDGAANSTDRVFVVLWDPNTVERNNLNLIQWGAFEVTLGTGPGMVSSDLYVNDVQLKPNIQPNLVWTFPTTGYVNTNYTAVNSSYDEHDWDFNSVTMRHERTRYGQNIQLINTVSGSRYNWDDGHQDIGLIGSSNGTHQWSLSGYYDVELVITDECATTVTGTKQIQIFNPGPTCGIKCHQATLQNINTPDTLVTFEFDGGDVNNDIVDIDWHIHDSGSYGNTDTIIIGSNKLDIISHTNGLGTSWCEDTATPGAFTNPGSHLIEATVHWHDGFSNQVLNCSEVFNQGKFSGPAINFTQSPPQATVGSGIIFENTSTNIGRIGKHPPECREYDWIWTDDGVVSTVEDVGYNIDLEKTPGSTDCSVKLIGYWNDGWALHTSELEEAVVFGTTIEVSVENCYYNLHISGTSSDGTTTGYHWEIYQDTVSGTGVGPWTQVWESPEDMEQNDKKIAFTTVSYYKIIGYVHGTGTTTHDDEILFVADICPPEQLNYVWNGTGALDTGSDWIHVGYGIENSDAMHTGTNGLDLTGLIDGGAFQFESYENEWMDVEVTSYDYLVFWAYVNSWEQDKHLQANLERVGVYSGTLLNIDDYINLTVIKQWQKIYIPLDDFEIPLAAGQLKYVNKLNFWSRGSIDLYIDDMLFVMGQAVTEFVAVCNPSVVSQRIGIKALDGKEVGPSMKVENVLPNVSSPIVEGKVIGDKDLGFVPMTPNMRGIMDTQSSDRIIHTFPPPRGT